MKRNPKNYKLKWRKCRIPDLRWRSRQSQLQPKWLSSYSFKKGGGYEIRVTYKGYSLHQYKRSWTLTHICTTQTLSQAKTVAQKIAEYSV